MTRPTQTRQTHRCPVRSSAAAALLPLLSLLALLVGGVAAVPAAAQAPDQAPADQGGAAQADAAEPDPDRINFNLPIPESEGGGIITGYTGTLELERDTYAVLAGGVDLRYRDIRLQADRAEVDMATQEVVASGSIILDQGPQRITGATIRYNLDSGLGTLTEATAYVDPDYYFSGAEISRTGDETFTVVDGTFTACSDEVPDWSFSLKRAEVELGGYAKVRSATMRVKKVPVLYTPYILWPAKTERASGFLVPQPGYSSRRGASMSLAYYQTLGRSYDTTFFADLYTDDYLGLGNEFRYQPSPGTFGRFEGYAIRDPERNDDWRWKVRLDHTTEDLPWGLRGAISIRDYSDFEYFQDFERDFDRVATRSINSRGFLTGNWGSQSLNLIVDSRETLLSGQDATTLRRLPEVEYRLRQTQLGSLPLYIQADSSLAFLSVDRPGSYEGDFGRIDLQPSLTAPLNLVPWLSLSVTAGQRFTWYEDSLCRQPTGPDDTGPGFCSGPREFTGDSLSRTFPVAGVEIVGPSFSRIFDTPGGKFSKLKHVIEPRWRYSYQGDIEDDERDSTPLFDEVDSLGRSINEGRFALVNRIKAKPSEEGESVREIFLFEVAQRYSFDEERPLEQGNGETQQAGPLEGLLRYNPSEGTSLKAEVTYSTLFDRMTSRSLSGSYLFPGENTVGLTWFTRYRAVDGETVGDQARMWTRLHLVPGRLRLEAQLNYDIEMSLLQQQRYLLSYNSQCWSAVFEYRQFERGQETDRDYRLLITLKNVGTFLDLSGRASSDQGF